jgi:hypothetical protein
VTLPFDHLIGPLVLPLPSRCLEGSAGASAPFTRCTLHQICHWHVDVLICTMKIRSRASRNYRCIRCVITISQTASTSWNGHDVLKWYMGGCRRGWGITRFVRASLYNPQKCPWRLPACEAKRFHKPVQIAISTWQLVPLSKLAVSVSYSPASTCTAQQAGLTTCLPVHARSGTAPIVKFGLQHKTYLALCNTKTIFTMA